MPFDLALILKTLEPYPIVQGAVGLIIVLAGIRLMRRAEKDKDAAEVPPPAPGGVADAPTLHLQGPMTLILEYLRDMRDAQRDSLKQEEEQTGLLREIERRQAIESERGRRPNRST